MRARWTTIALATLLCAATADGAAAQATPAAQTPRHTAADVRFVQMMIGHHQQALEMAALVPDRTDRGDLRTLAERIDVSQRDEIASMQRWLHTRGEALPDAHAHHAMAADSAHAHMPGMASPAEMAALAAARGPAFDRMFLERMIRHHEGALAMVAELFATPGAGQEAEIFQVANEVSADQRMEIDRMRMLLEAPPSRTTPR